MTVQRERYGCFGIASAPAQRLPGFFAWGRYGDTTGDSALNEPTEPVWFVHGETREQAIALIKADLDQVEPRPGSVVRLNGVRYLVYGLAQGAGSSRRSEVIVYADMETGRMYFRTRANFAERMEWNEVFE